MGLFIYLCNYVCMHLFIYYAQDSKKTTYN